MKTIGREWEFGSAPRQNQKKNNNNKPSAKQETAQPTAARFNIAKTAIPLSANFISSGKRHQSPDEISPDEISLEDICHNRPFLFKPGNFF